MPNISGTEKQAALKKAAAWGTALAAGAGDDIFVMPGSLRKEDIVEPDESLGIGHSKYGDRGPIKVEGDVPMYARYDGNDLFEALYMGSAGAPVQQAATSAYAYTYTWLDIVDGLFGTYVVDMVNYIEEYSSLKVIGLTFKGEIGKPCEYVFQCIAINKVTDSVINTTTTFNNVTFVETKNRVLFSHMVCRMNAQEGAALASPTDVIYPNSFEMAAIRKLVGQPTGEFKTANDVVQDVVDEPQNDGMPEITLKLGFARHSAPTYFEDRGNDKHKKIDMTFTGSQIESPYNRQKKFEFPNLQMTT